MEQTEQATNDSMSSRTATFIVLALLAFGVVIGATATKLLWPTIQTTESSKIAVLEKKINAVIAYNQQLIAQHEKDSLQLSKQAVAVEKPTKRKHAKPAISLPAVTKIDSLPVLTPKALPTIVLTATVVELSSETKTDTVVPFFIHENPLLKPMQHVYSRVHSGLKKTYDTLKHAPVLPIEEAEETTSSDLKVVVMPSEAMSEELTYDPTTRTITVRETGFSDPLKAIIGYKLHSMLWPTQKPADDMALYIYDTEDHDSMSNTDREVVMALLYPKPMSWGNVIIAYEQHLEDQLPKSQFMPFLKKSLGIPSEFQLTPEEESIWLRLLDSELAFLGALSSEK